MAGFDHKHNITTEAHDPPTAARNARYGAILFFVYLLLYGGFVGLCAFRPAAMDAIVFSGLNLAVVYGLFLIIAAFILALVYGWLCRFAVDNDADLKLATTSKTIDRERP